LTADVVQAKRQIRAKIAAWRDAQSAAERQAKTLAIWRHFAKLSEVAEAHTVMLYSAIRSEVSTETVLEHAFSSGKQLALPRVDSTAGVINAHLVTDLSELVRSSFGILEPSSAAPIVDPGDIDVVAVPGLAFDALGYRVGYGAGYYDRFLPLLRPDAFVAGIAFAGQRVSRVPRAKQDVRLLCLVTEEGVQRQPTMTAPDRSYDAYIFDLDGTVYLGPALIPGAAATISALRETARTVFLSNKPINTRVDYAEKLTRLGIPTQPIDVINSSAVLAGYLAGELPSASIYCVGEAPLRQELAEAGFRVLEDPAQEEYRVDVVVAAFDRTFDYAKLNNAYQCIKRGARFVATNADRTCPVEEGEIPDCAAMIGAISGASGVAPEIVVGKPHPLTAEAALKRVGVRPEDCLMVGDRVETDIAMGLKAGMETALVLSGASDEASIPREKVYPHFVVPSIAALLPGGV
jgi:5,10-methenyltetrahydrofolate synthetase